MNAIDPHIDDIIAGLFSSPDGRSRVMSRAKVAIGIHAVRPIDPQDFISLQTSSGYTEGAAPLKRLRATHHQLARLLAAGSSPEECTILTHYCASRISVLQSDPTFNALVESYRKELTSAVADIPGQLLNVALDSLQEFRDRLEDEPGNISDKDLLAAAKLGLDRAGYGPSSTVNNNHKHGLSDEFLAELAARANQESRATVVIGTVHKREIVDETNSQCEAPAGGVSSSGPDPD